MTRSATPQFKWRQDTSGKDLMGRIGMRSRWSLETKASARLMGPKKIEQELREVEEYLTRLQHRMVGHEAEDRTLTEARR
ncbi:hypothetical protein NDU88_005642 [Pleurodeles waltl]|uniref:Uncharacterized protein n=1 Tax=Pleurodeles waltl TaxID=8319 RepID=A0AAV7LLW0_PLEWA|nr:hypothetical protein NDU88_005642 [Pleurodeles waltl]